MNCIFQKFYTFLFFFLLLPTAQQAMYSSSGARTIKNIVNNTAFKNTVNAATATGLATFFLPPVAYADARNSSSTNVNTQHHFYINPNSKTQPTQYSMEFHTKTNPSQVILPSSQQNVIKNQEASNKNFSLTRLLFTQDQKNPQGKNIEPVPSALQKQPLSQEPTPTIKNQLDTTSNMSKKSGENSPIIEPHHQKKPTKNINAEQENVLFSQKAQPEEPKSLITPQVVSEQPLSQEPTPIIEKQFDTTSDMSTKSAENSPIIEPHHEKKPMKNINSEQENVLSSQELQPEEPKSLINPQDVSEQPSLGIQEAQLSTQVEGVQDTTALSKTLEHESKYIQPSQDFLRHVSQNWLSLDPQELSKHLIEQNLQKGADIISAWEKDYSDTTSNMYVQENLKDMLAQEFFVMNNKNEIDYVDKKSIKFIEKLQEKYRNNHDVYTALTEFLSTLHRLEQKQKTPKSVREQANKVISRYYTPAMKYDVLTGMGIQPQDPQNPSEILPTADLIIEYAQQDFYPGYFKALKATEKAVDIAIFAHQDEASFFGDSPLLAQCKQFKKEIQTILKKPQYAEYQNITEKIPQYTANFLDNTGFGDVTLEQAYKNLAQGFSTAHAVGNVAIDFMGVRPSVTLANQAVEYATNNTLNTTVLQAAEKIGLLSTPSEKALNSASVVKEKILEQSLKAPLSQKQQDKLTLLDQHIRQAQQESSRAMIQYGKPEDLQNIYKIMTQSSQATSTNQTMNMPTAQELIQVALNSPSQQSYNALQSMLTTVKITLRPELTPTDPVYMQGWTKYKQLKEYEQLLSQALQDPKIAQFQPLSSQVASYLPSAKTILTTTGISNMTLGQAGSTAQAILETGATYVQPVVNPIAYSAPMIKQLTGVEINPMNQVKNMTIRNVTDMTGLSTPARQI